MKQMKAKFGKIAGKDPAPNEPSKDDQKAEVVQKRRDRSIPRSSVFSNDGYIHTTTYR